MVTPGGFIARKESDVKTIDNLITNFGGCGPFQIRLVIATYSAQLCAVWGMMFMVFGNYHSDWQCRDNMTYLQNDSDIYNSTGANWTLDQYQMIWTSDEPSLDVNESLGNVTEGTSCDILETCQNIEFNQNSQTIVSEWALVCDKEWVQSFIIGIQMLGVLLGAHYGAYIGDRCGRRVNLYINVGFHTLFNLLAAFSVDWKMFACLRFFIGITVGGTLSCCLLYPIEFVGKWWRRVLGVFPVWNIGAATFSLAVIILKNWRHLHIATSLFSLLVFLLGFWVPESMRWLALHGKVERAKNIANLVASMNNRPPPNTTALEVFAKEERKRKVKGKHYEHIVDLFKTDKYFTLSVKMGFIWACLSLMYYTISFAMKFLTGDFYVNFIIFSVAEIPGIIFVGPVSRKLGARLGSLVYFVLILVACFGLVIANFAAPEEHKDLIIFVLALMAKTNILAAWMIMTVVSVQLYPEEVSYLSTDYLNTSARIGAIIAPFLIPNITGSLFVMFLILGIILFLCCLFLLSFPVRGAGPTEDDEKPGSHLSIIMEETELEVRSSECDST